MNYSRKYPKYKIKETRDIHPLAAQWLTKNGYSYVHEYQMPDYGIVDFYATKPDEILLLEVKGDASAIGAIFQVLGYGLQMPSARIAVAIPSIYITAALQSVAAKYNVPVISLDFDLASAQKKVEQGVDIAHHVHELADTLKVGMELASGLQSEKGLLWKEAIAVVSGSVGLAALMFSWTMKDEFELSPDEIADLIVGAFVRMNFFMKASSREHYRQWAIDLMEHNHWPLYVGYDE